MCTQCGECCSRFLPLSRRDIKQIRRYIKTHNVAYEPKQRSVLETRERNSCPFCLDNKTIERCSIYPARPEICQRFDCTTSLHGKLKGGVRLELFDMYEFIK